MPLEASIRADRTDPAPYLVYADWLQQQGHPFGELIVLSHAANLDAAKGARKAQLLDELALPRPDLATFEWRHGMWSTLRIENSADWMDDGFDAVAAARPLFEHIACAALAQLKIGVLRWESNHEDVPAVLAAAADQPWARDLPALALGDVDGNVDMGHHVIGDVGAVISRTFPRLRDLFLHSSEQTWHDGGETFGIAGLDLLELQRLCIETCSMSSERVAALLAANLPAVHDLELWFGSPDYGATATYADLQRLVNGSAFPHVTRLGLRNAMFTDDIARELGATQIASRLEALDLSMGTLGDAAALELASAARSFPRLASLNVDDNFLSASALATLREVFPKVISDGQKRVDPDYPARYVSVAE